MVKMFRLVLLLAVITLWVGTTIPLPSAIALLALAVSILIASYACLAAYDLGVVVSRERARLIDFENAIFNHIKDVSFLTLFPTPADLWRAVSSASYRTWSLLKYGILYPAYRVILSMVGLALSLWYFNALQPGYLLQGVPSDASATTMLVFTVENLVTRLTFDLVLPAWTTISFAPAGDARLIGWLFTFMALGACAALLTALVRTLGAYIILPRPLADALGLRGRDHFAPA